MVYSFKGQNIKNKNSFVKGIAWLVLTIQQAFVGCVLLSHFDNFLVVVAALASLLLAGAIVLTHFIKASR